jgi:7,8-dihydroneopterin aldolase/epimerase/oxygenase
MFTIALQQIKQFGYHGYYEEERVLGNYFIMDVEVSLPDTPEKANSLSQTINYESLLDIVLAEFHTPRQLLEELAQSISEHIKNQFPDISESIVAIKKTNPPLRASVENSVVTLHKKY